jgi:hypothetical protein
LEDAKVFNSRLTDIDKKLDSHGVTLENIRDKLYMIAEQKIEIANLQKMQAEHHTDINTIYDRLNQVGNWQAGCPRAQLPLLWTVIIACAGAFGSMFLFHIFSNGVKP